MARKKKTVAVKQLKKDNSISMVILGVVAVLAIVGLVLLFSAAQNAGLATGGRYGGDLWKDEGSFRHQNIRGIPATICPAGQTECYTEYLATATRRGVQDVAYNHVPAWLAYNEEIQEGRNRGYVRACGGDAMRMSYPIASYYMGQTNLKCDTELRKDASGICCYMLEDSLKAGP